MQLDPENTGRLEVARTLKAEGRPQAALSSLEALPLEPLGDDGVMLASELLILVGKESDALTMLGRLTPARRSLTCQCAAGVAQWQSFWFPTK